MRTPRRSLLALLTFFVGARGRAQVGLEPSFATFVRAHPYATGRALLRVGPRRLAGELQLAPGAWVFESPSWVCSLGEAAGLVVWDRAANLVLTQRIDEGLAPVQAWLRGERATETLFRTRTLRAHGAESDLALTVLDPALGCERILLRVAANGEPRRIVVPGALIASVNLERLRFATHGRTPRFPAIPAEVPRVDL